MSGGSRYEYLWADGDKYKKPTKLPAPKYIELLMDWIESQINNEELFPVTTGPKSLFLSPTFSNLQIFQMFPFQKLSRHSVKKF